MWWLTSLSGEDFDQRIMEYFIKLIKKKYNKDISKDNRALGKLRREAERAKRALSNQHQVCFWVDFIMSNRSSLFLWLVQITHSALWWASIICLNVDVLLCFQVRVEIESLFDGVDFSEPLTRARFEELNNDLFRKTMGPVKKALDDAKLSKSEINEIVLVGGSTR